MSNLNPKGVAITLNDGVERHFLFTIRVFDIIQDRYKETVFDILTRLGDPLKNARTLIELTTILVNDEVDMDEFRNGGRSELKRITEKEAGWLIDINNMEEVSTAILEAYGLTSPEPDEDEEDPNQKTVQQK